MAATGHCKDISARRPRLEDGCGRAGDTRPHKGVSECGQCLDPATAISRPVKPFAAVVTTGIYCRPGCGARPNQENVVRFALAAAAEAAGFRACLRCRPYRVAAWVPETRNSAALGRVGGLGLV